MNRAVSERVRQRAGNRCEYCGVPQADSGLRFHVEHVIASQHGGSDDDENLARSCPDCNWHKGTNLTGLDPDSGGCDYLVSSPARPVERSLLQ
ncbi:MAG: HNH endonuclease [Prosthecobacter sp.]